MGDGQIPDLVRRSTQPHARRSARDLHFASFFAFGDEMARGCHTSVNLSVMSNPAERSKFSTFASVNRVASYSTRIVRSDSFSCRRRMPYTLLNCAYALLAFSVGGAP